MTPHHHPSEDLLVAYAAGHLAEAPSLVVATHLALCPDCRAEVRRLEALGGALLEEMAPTELDDGLLAAILGRLDGDPDVAVMTRAPAPAKAPAPAAAPAGLPPLSGRRAPLLPEPLRSYVGGDLDAVPWTRVMRGVEESRLLTENSWAKLRLMRIAPGTAMPRHTHTGSELTLVLTGAFRDETGHYGRGDFAATDGSVDHQPVADEGEPCVCLAVTDAPLKLTGPFGRLLNPFLKL